MAKKARRLVVAGAGYKGQVSFVIDSHVWQYSRPKATEEVSGSKDLKWKYDKDV